MYRVIFDNALSLQHVICFFHLWLVRQNLTPSVQQLGALKTHSVRHLTARVLSQQAHLISTVDICPVAPAYLIWAYYAHGRQRRCEEDPVGLRSGRLEKTTGSSPHHMAQHHPTRSETSSSYAPRSCRFGSEPPSVEDDVDVWRYAIVSCMPETTNDDNNVTMCLVHYSKRH